MLKYMRMSESRQSFHVSTDNDAIAADDEQLLKAMGYKQELNRGLGALMNFAFGFTEVGVIAW